MIKLAVKGEKFMADEQNLDTQNQGLDNDNGNGKGQGQDVPPKTYTQEEFEQALKEAEAKGYGKGKFDTNAKWEKTAKEREKKAKEEAEKQAAFEKMSDLQKAETRATEAETELQALKDELALNTQREETRKLMKEKDLSDVFLNAVLVPKDADATLNNIIEVKALFDAEVQKAVEGRIKTHTPKQNIEQGNIDMALARETLGLKS